MNPTDSSSPDVPSSQPRPARNPEKDYGDAARKYKEQESIVRRMMKEVAAMKKERYTFSFGEYVTIPSGEHYAPEDVGVETVTDCLQNVSIVNYIEASVIDEVQDRIAFMDENNNIRFILVSDDILEANDKPRN